MNSCPQCKQPAGVNANTIEFGPNNRGCFDCFTSDLEILGIFKEDFKNVQPINSTNPDVPSYLNKVSLRIFSVIYQKLKKSLDTISADDLKSYKENSPQIMEIQSKFLALKRICLATNISYKEKMEKFYFYNAQEVKIGDIERADLLVKIDFFARKTKVSIQTSKANSYTPGSRYIFIPAKEDVSFISNSRNSQSLALAVV